MKWSELSVEQRDALIHEKVMQKTEPEICDYDPKMTVMTTGDDPTSADWHCYKCGAHGKVTRDGYYRHPQAIPRYTTSMDAACAIPIHPSFFGANTEIVCVPKGYWRCHVDFHQQGKEYHGFADTPAEAVCIAFLRAVGIEIEQQAEAGE